MSVRRTNMRSAVGCRLSAKRRARGSRRGVLLLVVLSMLVLFMLIGTAFLMTSNQARTNAKSAAKLNRTGNYATELLDRAILQILRDTENPFSAIRYHSLLRDLYGTDGFESVAFRPDTVDATTAPYLTRFAGATTGTLQQQLGPTQGQLVDIFVDVRLGTGPTPPHAVKLERDMFGHTVPIALSMTKGYYNGCLLTVTTGPAAGGSGRILDYEVIRDPSSGVPVVAAFRVMNFSRADGTPLQIDASRTPEISDLAGATFIVNGRAYNGTGVGYNPLAPTGAPRLTALQLMQYAGSQVGTEIALTPNSTYLDYAQIQTLDPTSPTFPDPFEVGATFLPLNDLTATPLVIAYPTFDGAGGADEGYDAADFQNMFLALQSVTPRAQGRVVHSSSTTPLSAADPTVLDGTDFLRLDLEDLPLPSYHRPALVNFWYHRLIRLFAGRGTPSDDLVRAVISSAYQPDGTPTPPLNAQQAALITAIKRKISLRPIREDHPNFDGSNPQSRGDMSAFSNLILGTAPNYSISVPYWEAVGPWDVDNDNDGVPDSIWVDLGDPVTQAEDGTRYKPLYAILVLDLDSRLNVNAHGLVDHIAPPFADPTKANFDPTGGAGNLAHDVSLGGGLRSSMTLPRGIGYGPAEISLRPLLPQPWVDATGTLDFHANQQEDTGTPIDSYATLLAGRTTLGNEGISGKYGYIVDQTPQQSATPGTNYDYLTMQVPASPTGDNAVPDLLAQLKFIGYPLGLAQLSAFGTPPDLMGRYSLGLDYIGQPYYEVTYDRNPNVPAATFPNRALLTDSPYEIDFSSSSRRDTWALAHDPAATPANLFTQSLSQNDDAPFATSDLERILRAFDADAGSLPSRLWDVVDVFDPLKLGTYDPFRVTATATSAFGGNSDPELLAAAQVMASIARRLVTTDSFSLPVPGSNLTQRALYGMDALPGVPGVDDDGNGVVDDGQDYVAVVEDDSIVYDPTAAAPCDDYIAVMRAVRDIIASTPPFSIELPLSPGLTDYLRYRILVELVRRGNIAPGMTAANVEETVNRIIHGNGLLAPELIAGLRMDLNRPFGDGVDNPNPITGLGNGVVDDPLEAGEPFLDLNGNGKRDSGEPFIDILPGDVDGDGSPYDGPRDQLWGNLTANGTLTEPIAFDHTNGHGEPIHPEVAAALPGNPVNAQVRNLESQSRQLYARHLYCLMLLSMDENYIAPFDETDPQIRQWIADVKAARTITDAEAALVVARKNTYRQIAQWAINCADMRDSDAIMTPFEYDENPWDGWGVPDEIGIMLPLDGDPLTDENLGEAINWVAIDPDDGGPKPPITALVVPSPDPTNHTRAVVWGAERPELLITETLAFHDRRTEDLETPGGATAPGHGLLQPGAGPGRRPPDPHMDQSLRPRGSLFVELYNAWSGDGQKPAELYSRVDVQNGYAPLGSDGIDLSRLSNLGVNGAGMLTGDAAATTKRSPVWRLVVVEDWPEARNRDQADDYHNQRYKRDRNNISVAYKPMTDLITGPNFDLTDPPAYRMPNPDFGLAFDTTFVARQRRTVVPGETRDNVFDVAYPYIEREFYFTTDGSPTREVHKPEFKLRIPDRSMPFGRGPAAKIYQTQRFIPAELESPGAGVDIAPILPGRYAVLGSTGTKYPPATAPPAPQIYTTTIGRLFVSGNTPDNRHFPQETRRIELLPRRDISLQPQQLLVAGNGGDPQNTKTLERHTPVIQRDNELVLFGGAVANVTDSTGGAPDGMPDVEVYQPAVAVPVEGMNISEPPWGYEPREKEVTEQAVAQGTATAGEIYRFNPRFPGSKNEGRYVRGAATSSVQASFDIPFDFATPELMRTGTTPNYRILHLQRLANPLLPWNPEPKLPDGSPNPEHQANLPINPYRTVDSSSVDLTAFNGVSSREDGYVDASSQRDTGQFRPWITGEVTNYALNFRKRFGAGGPPIQAWYLKSLERGHWNQLNLAGAAAPQRVLWAQEPAHVDLRRTTAAGGMRLIDGIDRSLTMVAPALPGSPNTPAGANVDIYAEQEVHRNQVDAVMEHSLGFGNETAGLLYDQDTSGSRPATEAPTPSAVGAPAAGYDYSYVDSTGATPTVRVDSTHPWFAWNNRPFVSAEELMQVPAASSAAMLSHFSTATLSAATTPPTPLNPYDGSGIGVGTPPAPVPPDVRLAQSHAPFGHLLNFFATANFPSAIVPPTAPATIPVGTGATHFYRFLEYVRVPSRFVGTETVLAPEVFNDVPGVVDPPATGGDILGPNDPRYRLQPPFNKVSERRDPGKVNLNTVIGRRVPGDATVPRAPQIWSEVYDGIMHRYRDDHVRNTAGVVTQLGHFGPAWRDVALSRRGYAQTDAAGTPVDWIAPIPAAIPDTLTFGLNNSVPTFFANPFRSPNAGDLVPLANMVQVGVQASMLRSHPYSPGVVTPPAVAGWGQNEADDTGGDGLDGLIDDAREAGFGDDALVPGVQSGIPLFAEGTNASSIDTNRNPYMMYQPMTRLGNLVTTRSGVFAIWVTVGYFEVEPAPDWNNAAVQARFSNNRALYDRVYPEGYTLGKEVGSETGNTRRQRGFYIVDRTEAVGFKPGEDLNVEKMIRLRRRIE